MRRWIVIAVGLLIVACAAIFIFARSSRSFAGGANPAAKTNIQTARIDRGDLRSVVTATGAVVANEQSKLSFDQPGMVVALNVTEGQHVEAGQVLAQVDDTTQKFNVQQAEFTVEAAQAALNKLLEPVDTAD